ncbi:MAG: low molecular weight protein arginine phosphatase [Oscillospiraceae bacterium]
MKKIIVVCTGNTCRSPMVEGIINDLIKKNNIPDTVVFSAGLAATDGEKISKYAIDALAEISIDISSYRSKSLIITDLYDADIIYTMTIQHKNVILEAFDGEQLKSIEKKIVVMDIPDPFCLDLDKYRETRDMIIKFFKDNY